MADTQHATDLGLELHHWVARLDPAKWRDEKRDELVAGFALLAGRFEEATAQFKDTDAQGEYDAVMLSLRAGVPTSSDLKNRWMEFRQEIHPRYEALASALRAHHVELPSLRPTNYTRSIMHVFSGFLGFSLVEFAPWNAVIGVALGFAVLAWTLELTRRKSHRWNEILMWFLGPVAHPHERFKVNSATWYATALILLSMTGEAAACAAGLIALGLGDPAAAFVGRKWGRTKLIHNRSLEGSTAFFVVASAFVFLAFQLFHTDLSLSTKIIAALVAGLVGAIAELLSGNVDDNFSIPLFAGLATWAALALLA